MARKEPLSPREISVVNGVLIEVCQRLDMEFAVACMQGDGPLEIFQVECNAKWLSTTKEIRKRIKAFAAESKTLAQADKQIGTQLMRDMTEPELSEHLNQQLRFIRVSETADTIGSMLVIFQDDGICQYGATSINPDDAPAALRELADRLEKRQTVKRDGKGN